MMMNFLKKLLRLVYRYPGCPPHEDLFEFTLDGLQPEEGQRVREHLARCYGCREQIKEYAWVNEGIALNAPLAEAPEGLCDKVKERIKQDPGQIPPKVEYAPSSLQAGGWPLFWMRMGPVFALASLMMSFVALGALMSRGGAGTTPLLSQAQELLGNPKARTISLKGALSGKCAGKVTLAPGMDVMLINVENLEPCPQGRVYSVWMCGKGSEACRLAGFQTEGLKQSEYLLHLAKPFQAGEGPLEIRVLLGKSGAGARKMDGELHLKGQADL